MVALKDENEILHTTPKKVVEIHAESLTDTIAKNPKIVLSFEEIEKRVEEETASVEEGSKEQNPHTNSSTKETSEVKKVNTDAQTIEEFEIDDYKIREAIKETVTESSKESLKDSFTESVKESVQESLKGSFKETFKEAFKESCSSIL